MFQSLGKKFHHKACSKIHAFELIVWKTLVLQTRSVTFEYIQSIILFMIGLFNFNCCFGKVDIAKTRRCPLKNLNSYSKNFINSFHIVWRHGQFCEFLQDSKTFRNDHTLSYHMKNQNEFSFNLWFQNQSKAWKKARL